MNMDEAVKILDEAKKRAKARIHALLEPLERAMSDAKLVGESFKWNTGQHFWVDVYPGTTRGSRLSSARQVPA